MMIKTWEELCTARLWQQLKAQEADMAMRSVLYQEHANRDWNNFFTGECKKDKED